MNKLKFFFSLFLPILIMIVGGLIWVAGGVNDCTQCQGIFDALLTIPTVHFWVGLVVNVIGVGLIVKRYFIKNK